MSDDTGRRAPGHWTRTFGDLRVTHLPDAVIEVVPTAFFATSTDDDWAARPELVDAGGHLIAGAGALLLERGDDRVIVDTGLGPVTIEGDDAPALFTSLRGGGLPGSCEAAGLDPSTIGTVAFTHLHSDHVGWATNWSVDDGRSLFPTASWLVGVGEADGPHRDEALSLAGEGERIREVADGEEILRGVRAWSLPGHTSGHTAWVCDTGDGGSLILFGDAMHSPAQVEHPEWTVAVDSEGPAAERARRTLIAELARPEVLGLGIHFADQQIGRVVDGRWVGA